VAIVDRKLFTMGNDNGKEYVFCLDTATGEEEWRFSYDCDLMPRLYPGGPNATPTVEERRVYTISRLGHIFCFDATTGKKVWDASAEQWVPKGGWWGFSGSPTIIDDLVFFNVGDKGLALDKKTGKVVWASQKDAKAYSTVVPLPREMLGRAAIVVQTTAEVQVLDPRTGQSLLTTAADWRTRSSNCNGVTPRPYQGSLYVVQGKQGLSKLSCRDDTWAEDWLCKRAAYSNDWFAFNQQVFHDGFALAIVGDSRRDCRFVCVDLKTGEPAWENTIEYGNLLLAGDTLLILSQTGELAWGKLDGGQYREQHRSKPLSGGRGKSEKGLYWPYPVLLDGKLYARTTKGHLSCLGFE
jgi:outer membrane protein assembly factor BamB